MNTTLEIRWHGRGGQGTKTAALMLAEAAFHHGAYSQGFPEYGPERMGAPITAYNRISSRPITIHSNIDRPGLIAVVDDTLIEAVDILSGLNPGGMVIVNTARSESEIRSRLGGFAGPLMLIDARRISEETIGRNFPNIPMLAAVVKGTALMSDEQFTAVMSESLAKKFAGKTLIIDGNLEAVRRTLKELTR